MDKKEEILNRIKKWAGKNIKKWLDPEIYERLNEIFSHFDKEDSWKALEARLNLFRDLSKATMPKGAKTILNFL